MSKRNPLRHFLLFVLVFFISVCHGQIVQENFAEDEAFAYKAELTGGMFLSTNGGLPGGIRVKYAWQRKNKPKQFDHISLDIANIRHPKEYRAASDSGNGYFIVNKMNYLFVIRPSVGREFLLFQKSSEEGLELKLNTSFGPSIGLQKPYYIIVSNGRQSSEIVAYQPGVRADRILGNSFFSGFDEITAVLGLNARVSLEFGVSAWDDFVTGVELGFQVEAFSRKVIIIPYSVNKATFTSAFVNLYFGKRY